MPDYNPYMLQIAQRRSSAEEALELLGYAIAVIGSCLLSRRSCSDRESIESVLRSPDSLVEENAILRRHMEALKAIAKRVNKQFFWPRLHSLLLNDMRRLGLLKTYRYSNNRLVYVSPDESGWPQKAHVEPGPALIAANRVLDRCLAETSDTVECLRLAGALALLLFLWLDGGSGSMHRVFHELFEGGDEAIEGLAKELSGKIDMEEKRARQMLQGMLEALTRAMEVVEDARRGQLREIVPAYYLPLRPRRGKGGAE